MGRNSQIRSMPTQISSTPYPEGYNSQYMKRHAQPSLDNIAEVATEAASGAERPRNC